MRVSIAGMLIAALFTTRGAADCAALQPVSLRELPQPDYAAARSVVWRDDHRLLIGTRGKGIVEYDLSAKSPRGKPIVNAADIGDVEDLDTDGKTVVAFNRERVDITFDLNAGKLVKSRQQAAMRVIDLVVRDGRVAVLGYSFTPSEQGGLWLGKAGAPWREHKLLYETGKTANAFFREAGAPYAGAMTFIDAETVAVITPVAVGVRRFTLADGKPLPTLGKDMTALVNDLTAAVTTNDLDARYARINAIAVIDDLVALPDGAAVVVRTTARNKVQWALWRPFEGKRRTAKVPLSVDDSHLIGAHLRCDARGWKVVCVVRGEKPRLVEFDAGMVTKCQ